ncbi:LAFA_0D10154g1_1 [Lachancea sp. 'fantastica']|nr:LAFA_0D10154g1_1 [Lachancea sp. 'fantastica']
MPQKALKVTKQAKDPRRVTKKQKNLRKAAPLQIKSKKKSLSHLKKLNKVSSLTVSTEKLIASRVGHLELLKGTRKELETQKKKDSK